MEADGDISFGIDDENTSFPEDTVTSTSANYDDNAWHHLSAVKDANDNLYLYIDGNLIDTDATISATDSLDNNDDFYLGIDGDGSSNAWVGFIDEFKFYRYARSADEIKADLAKGAGVKGAQTSYGIRDYSYLSEGLVGYWEMDDPGVDIEGEISTDSSGNGNDGTLYGDDSTGDNGSGMDCTVSGKFGTGCDFDNTDDYIGIADSSELKPSVITISAWINVDTITEGTASWILDKDYWNGYSIYQDDDNIGFYGEIGGTGGHNWTTTTNKVSATIGWQHVAYTFDGNAQKIYIDGNLEGTNTSLSGTLGPDSEPIRIGSRRSDASARYFDGQIDEVRLYNRVLSPAEVRQLADWAPGPVGYWPMDEGGGTGTDAVNDRSGNSNHGDMESSMTEDDWVNGKYGSALDFDEVDDDIRIPDTTDLDFGEGSFSVGIWIYPRTLPGSYNQIIGDRSTGAGWVIKIDNNGGAWRIEDAEVSDGTDSAWIDTSSNSYSYYQWHHIMMTFNGDTKKMTIYVNGVEDSSDTEINVDSVNIANDIYIASKTGSEQYFDGLIDDARIYNYVRTQAQIIEDMNAGHPAPGSPVGTPLSHWQFDEGYGDTINDIGIGGNNGDLAGSGTTCPQTSSACPTWTNSGKFNKALDYDKTDDYVFVSSGFTNTIKGDDTHTVSAWIYPRTVSGDTTVITMDDGASYGFYIVLYTGGYYVSYGGNWRTYTSTYSLYEWQHIAVVKNGTGDNMTLYLNGVEQTSYTGTVSSIPNTDDDLLIGKHPEGYVFDGKIDEVKVYNIALTAAQVNADMNYSSSSSFGNVADQGNEGFGGSAPIGWWKMDENTGTSTDAVKDTSGNDNHGTPTGSMTESDWVAGKHGSAMDFDGSNDNISVGDISSVLDLSSTNPSSFTISAWFKKPTGGGGDVGGIDLMTGSRVRLFYRESNNTFYFQLIPSQTTVTYAAPFGSWYHAVGVYDTAADEMKLYVNGVLRDTDTPSSEDLSSWSMGMDIGFAEHYYLGLIDNVRLYDYARTPAQIAWDFNRGAPVGYWQLDDCSGTTVYDAGSGENNGTITIGTSGSNTSAGTCGGSSGEAWYHGSTGKRNASLDFDGTDDFADLGSPNALNFTGRPDMTVTAWMKSDALTTYDGILSNSQGGGDTTVRFAFGYYNSGGNPNKLSLDIGDGVAYTSFYSADDALTQNDRWYFVGVTITSSNEVKLYVDGQQSGSTNTLDRDLASSAASWKIGRNYNSSSYSWDGQIDEVKIWNYSLTADQVLREYNNGAQFFGPLEGSP